MVLVPHSLGGLNGPVVAARRPLRALEATMRIMYGDLEPDDAEWAVDRLRPQAQKSRAEPSPAPPEGIRTESIIGATDRIVSPAWSRRVARERLGVEPVELPGGHFPMITHPELLAERLARLDAG